MPRLRACALSMLLAATLAAIACGDPPEKEMQQAQGAIDAARAAGADEYAHDEFVAAEDALKHAREAVDQRDYRLALTHAVDSRERAQNAAKEAADHKASARADADRALADASAALATARLKLKTAEGVRVPARTLAESRRAMADGEQGVQKARAAYGRGDYLAVPGLASPAKARLLATARTLDAAVAVAARRRR